MSSAAAGGESPEKTSDPTEKRQARRLLAVLVIIALFFVVELAGAKAALSDVLEADAYHLLMDVFALAVSLAAMRLASARPGPRFTFGLRRAEPIAALVNGVLILAVAQELVRDGLHHLSNPTTPKPGLMLIVASFALVVNGISAWILHGAMHGHHGHSHGGHSHGGHDHGAHDHGAHAHEHDDHGHDHDDHAGHDHAGHDHAGHDHAKHDAKHATGSNHLNLRGAWLHLIGDALGSLAAFGAGLAIRFDAPPIVDPLASFIVVAILLVGAVRLLRDAMIVLLEAAPVRVPAERVSKLLRSHAGVQRVHAVHVWSLGSGHDAVMARVDGDGTDPTLAATLSARIKSDLTIAYVTVQVDVADAAT